FAETRPEEIAAIIEAAPLACVVAATSCGLIANHIPLLVAPDGTLIGHAALANDMHRDIAEGQEVLAVFRGDNAFVSPIFYPSMREQHQHVLSWSCESFHIHGHISFQHDSQTKRSAVGLLTRLHERRLNGTAAWRMADAPAV